MENKAAEETQPIRPVLMEAVTWDTERAMPTEFPAWVDVVSSSEHDRTWAMQVANTSPADECGAPRAERRYVAIVACARGAMVRTGGATPHELLTNMESAVRRWWRSDPAHNFDPVPRIAVKPWSHVALAMRP